MRSLNGIAASPTAEIRAQADEIARGRQSDEDKAAALYYWVSQNIRYVSLSFGVGRYQPHSAAEVLANRYGDCKDKTTLLEAMLDAEGLHAQPALANLVADIDPEIPNPLQFDHVITFLPLGSKESWLDTTLGVGPFGYLLNQLRGKRVSSRLRHPFFRPCERRRRTFRSPSNTESVWMGQSMG